MRDLTKPGSLYQTKPMSPSVQSFRDRISSLPTHTLLVVLCIIWIIPTLGLLVTSFRPRQDVDESGWWTLLNPPKGAVAFAENCSACHGNDGTKIAHANLSNSTIVSNYQRSTDLLGALNQPINGQPHMGTRAIPDRQAAADIAAYMLRLSGIEARPVLTLDNYIDALVGYRGDNTYSAECAAGTISNGLHCNLTDILNHNGMGLAFLNSLLVAVPSTILPIVLAILAAYAFSWFDFPGRLWIYIVLVALQIIPLQMTLIPISRLYSQLGMNQTFQGIWLFHTGFGMPYAIYLMRNFMVALPREMFEAAHLDGAGHWTAFRQLAVPLCVPAIASLAIFQFLWIWNDLLVALVFLGGGHPVLTYQISNMVTSLGAGWQLLTAAAFLSMILPLIVFFALQRYFVSGLLAGSVKG